MRFKAEAFYLNADSEMSLGSSKGLTKSSDLSQNGVHCRMPLTNKGQYAILKRN